MSEATAEQTPTTTDASDRSPDPATAPPRPPARWPLWLAIYLACFAGASVGWFRTRPLYRSEAMVQFTPRAAAASDLVRPPLDPDFVAGQARIAASERIVDQATRSPLWAKTGLPATPAGIEDVRRNLEAHSSPGGILTLAFHHPDPKVAQSATQAIAQAYFDFTTNMGRVRMLDDRRMLVSAQLARLNNELRDTSTEFGTADLSIIHTFRTQEMLRLERQVLDATSPSPNQGTSRPAPAWLVERYELARRQASEAARAMLKFQDLTRQRDEAYRERADLEQRIIAWSLNNALPAVMEVISTGHLPASPAIDHRPRNAALGALAGLVLFLFGRLLFRAWRSRRRVVSARTAFPLITPAPRPVVPIPAETPTASPDTPSPAAAS